MKSSRLKIKHLLKPFDVLPDELMADISPEAFRVLMWMRMMDYNNHASSEVYEMFINTHYKGDNKAQSLVNAINELADKKLYWDGDLYRQRYNRKPTGFSHIDTPQKDAPTKTARAQMKPINLNEFSLRSGRCKYTINSLKSNTDSENVINAVVWKHKFLSYKTKEIFQCCYDHADEGEIVLTDHLLNYGFTPHSISKAFKQLITYGFARRIQKRGDGERWTAAYYCLYDVPQQNETSPEYRGDIKTWDAYYSLQQTGLPIDKEKDLHPEFYDLHPEFAPGNKESLHPATSEVCTRSLHPEFAPGEYNEESSNDGDLKQYIERKFAPGDKESLHPEFAPGNYANINELMASTGGNLLPEKLAYIVNYIININNNIINKSLIRDINTYTTDIKEKNNKKRKGQPIDLSFLNDLNDQNDPMPKFHAYIKDEYPFVFKTFLRDDIRAKYQTRWIMSYRQVETLKKRYSVEAIDLVLNSIESRDGDNYMNKYKDLYRVIMNWGAKAQVDVDRLRSSNMGVAASQKYLDKADVSLNKTINIAPAKKYGSLN